MPAVIFKDLSFQIMAAAFEVHNTLGFGFLENVYQRALLKELQLRGIPAESQKEMKVFYKDEEVGLYFPDIVVNDQIVIELKAVAALNRLHAAQVLNYLKGTGFKVGLLINFGKEKVESKRLIL
ncbi:PDDEXK_3 family protein [Geotalea daltonii FRC-32]|uniref:PDDEXK_3 family protein n=1 Tax=Geotalea daltonii (strain DSM 22248 / JCM 15807 / FRC-32) TaxID=316067 RepID=B9M8Y0_GEODF|nr:GxxExxY protein [Geotalea daltonii]ACM20476.1 PDDEXK_3 family protein [Geotalea daltonii FRC-32]